MGRKGKKQHYMSETPTYKSWSAMIERCTNPNHVAYHRYGGRGIKVCERWRDFKNFCEDMGGRLPHSSLDRINNDGDYEPGNCRWAPESHQHQGITRNKKQSKYIGVQKWKRKEGFAWGAQIKVNGKSKFLGVAKTEEEAAKLYDEAALFYYGKNAKTNFKR